MCLPSEDNECQARDRPQQTRRPPISSSHLKIRPGDCSCWDHSEVSKMNNAKGGMQTIWRVKKHDACLFYPLNGPIFVQGRVTVGFCCFPTANDSAKNNNDNGVGPSRPKYGNKKKACFSK